MNKKRVAWLFIGVIWSLYFWNGLLASFNIPCPQIDYDRLIKPTVITSAHSSYVIAWGNFFQPIWLSWFWSVIPALTGSLLLFARPDSRLIKQVATIVIGLLCHLTPDVGARAYAVEGHFVFFIALVFLAQALDYSLLITFTLVTGIGHTIMGYWLPMCLYGVPVATWSRAWLHAGYVAAQVVGLCYFIKTRKYELQQVRDSKRETLEERELRRQLEESNQSLRQFAYIASHDLQTPLRAISGFSELLRRKLPDISTEIDRYLAFIEQGVETMRELIQGLLDYSRALTAGITWDITDLNVLVQEVLNFFPDQRERVVVAHLPLIRTDKIRIERILMNLISNALKYVPSGVLPQIWINAFQENDSWHIIVQDSGVGIAAESLPKLGAPFYRVYSKEEYPGNGVGLASCKIAASRLGGKVWLTSEGLGKGTIAHLRLPTHV